MLILRFRFVFLAPRADGNSSGQSTSLEQCVYEVFLHVSSNSARFLDVNELRQRMMDEFQRRHPSKNPRILRTVWAQFASYTQFLRSGKLI